MKSNRWRWVICCAMALLILVNLAVLLISQRQIWQEESRSKKTLDAWRTQLVTEPPVPTEPPAPSEPPEPSEPAAPSEPTTPTEVTVAYPELLEAMRQYNRKIYEEAQAELVSAAAYEKTIFKLTDYGVESEIAGIITIPCINLEMPLYLGANYRHLADGLAQLSQTSVPIGGENTNCVIAGHRGWKGMPYLRDIEKIQVGDTVWIQNLWETLEYQVSEIQVIAPHEISKLLIQPGRDLVTLVSCHPYLSGGRQRMAVFCERVVPEAPPEETTGMEETPTEASTEAQHETVSVDRVTVSTGEQFQSSETLLFVLYDLPWILLAISLCGCAVAIGIAIAGRKKRK